MRDINHRGHGESPAKSKGQRAKSQPRARACRLALCALLFAVLPLWVLCGSNKVAQTQTSDLALPEEKHLRNIRQLTFGGENAEAYFSADGKKLIFQSTRDGYPCDQIYEMNIDGSGVRKLSTGKGRTTCSYYFPDGSRFIYSSTHEASADCPPKADYSRGYVWPIYPSYDIYSARPDGSDLRNITNSPGYDAESTIAPNGKRIVFT